MRKNVGLELFRGLAALMVLTAHLEILPGFADLTGRLRLLTHWGTEAVVVFFVLSGVVIRLSQDHRPRSRAAFAAARVRRILPLYLLAVAFSILVAVVAGAPLAASTILGNLLFLQSLQGYIVPTLDNNPPLWSLAYEGFFYLIFGLTIGPGQKSLLRVWFVMALAAALAVSAGLDAGGLAGHLAATTSFSCIWLVGYWLPSVPDHIRPGPIIGLAFLALVPAAARIDFPGGYYSPAKYLFVSVFLCPVFLVFLGRREVADRRRGWWWLAWAAAYPVVVAGLWLTSASLPTSKALYTVLPAVVSLFGAALVGRLLRVRGLLGRVSLVLGRLSFALYLFHYPILSVARPLGMHPVWALMVLPGVAIIVAAAAEFGVVHIAHRYRTGGRTSGGAAQATEPSTRAANPVHL